MIVRLKLNPFNMSQLRRFYNFVMHLTTNT